MTDVLAAAGGIGFGSTETALLWGVVVVALGALVVGWVLRGVVPERWVRFHSLPESKRYAESEDEEAEVLRRHLTLLDELTLAAKTRHSCSTSP